MGRFPRFPVVRRLVGAGGRVQAVSDVRERCATIGAQEAVVSDFGETLWVSTYSNFAQISVNVYECIR